MVHEAAPQVNFGHLLELLVETLHGVLLGAYYRGWYLLDRKKGVIDLRRRRLVVLRVLLPKRLVGIQHIDYLLFDADLRTSLLLPEFQDAGRREI